MGGSEDTELSQETRVCVPLSVIMLIVKPKQWCFLKPKEVILLPTLKRSTNFTFQF